MKVKVLVLLVGLLTAPPLRAHDHYAGGVNAAGTQLVLYNVPTVANPATTPAVTVTMEARLSGQLYGGYHVLDDNSVGGFTFTSRFRLLNDPNPAAPNSDLWMRITQVIGPSGGQFGFWEQENDSARVNFFNTPSTVLLANQPTGGFMFPVSEHVDGDPEPGGHIHFRAWTVDRPGTYDVTYQLTDRSGQQTDSIPYVFRFVAVPEPGSALLLIAGALACSGRWRRRSA